MNSEAQTNPPTQGSPEEATPQPAKVMRDRPGGVPGWTVVVATLSLFIVVPAFVALVEFVLGPMVTVETPALDWEQREQWRASPVRAAELRRGAMSSARNNQTYFPLDFEITVEQELATWRCVQLVELGGFEQANAQGPSFRDDATLAQLRQTAAEHPGLFYPYALIAAWHRLHGNDSQAQSAWHRAIELAPAIILQRYVDDQGKPIAGLAVGRSDVALDRIANDVFDQSFKLAYPAQVTDEQGFVYMPVYEMKYRMDRQPQPPDLSVAYSQPTYFTFPPRVGLMPDAVVRPLGQAAQTTSP